VVADAVVGCRAEGCGPSPYGGWNLIDSYLPSRFCMALYVLWRQVSTHGVAALDRGSVVWPMHSSGEHVCPHSVWLWLRCLHCCENLAECWL